MPIWAEDNTARVWVKIRSHKQAHTVKARLINGISLSGVKEAITRIGNAYAALNALLPTDIAVLECRWAPFGTSESQPIDPTSAWDLVTGAVTPQLVHTAKYLNMVGRAAGRSFTSIKFWGIAGVAQAAADDDYSGTELEYPGITAAKNALDGSEPLFVCRNGAQAVFASTMKNRVAAYWQTELRNG